MLRKITMTKKPHASSQMSPELNSRIASKLPLGFCIGSPEHRRLHRLGLVVRKQLVALDPIVMAGGALHAGADVLFRAKQAGAGPVRRALTRRLVLGSIKRCCYIGLGHSRHQVGDGHVAKLQGFWIDGLVGCDGINKARHVSAYLWVHCNSRGGR